MGTKLTQVYTIIKLNLTVEENRYLAILPLLTKSF